MLSQIIIMTYRIDHTTREGKYVFELKENDKNTRDVTHF